MNSLILKLVLKLVTLPLLVRLTRSHSRHSTLLHYKLFPRTKTNVEFVIDLSFPSGNSVGGILKDSFLDAPFHLTLPGLVNFIRMIVKHGPRCFLFKKDLKQAYRQIPVDPIDYQYLGYNWRRKCYFNLVLPFNLHSATMACQCSTNAVAYIFKLETKCD